MKALVLDAWTRAAVSVVQSLGRLGVEVHAESYQPCLAFRSRYVSAKLHRGADSGPQRLLAWLHEHNEREQYTLIVPSSEVSLRAMQALPDGGILRGKAVLASRASVATALDKMETRELAQRLGVRVPPSRVLLADSPAPPAPDYPIVLKTAASQVLVGGSYRYAQPRVARNLWERQRFLEEWSEHCTIEEQRFVPGRGWGVACLYDRGRLQWHFTHERLHEIPLTGGASTYRRAAAMNEELVGPARTVLDALGWHGVAMVEFRVDESGGVTFLEINPRLWGSLPLSAKAGVDFAAGLLGLARGEQLPDAACLPSPIWALSPA